MYSTYYIQYTVWHVYIEWYRLHLYYRMVHKWDVIRQENGWERQPHPGPSTGRWRVVVWMAETLTNDLLDRYAALYRYMQILLDVYELTLAHIDSYYMSYIYICHLYVYTLWYALQLVLSCTWYCTHWWNHKWLNAGGLDLIISATHCAASLPTRESRRSTKVTFVHLSSFHRASVLQNPSFISKIIFQLSSNIVLHP